jgi:uncharacterized membrane protein
MPIFRYSLNLPQKMTFICALLLCLLCIAWELFLSPLRPHGSLMALKFLPLGLMLPGLYQGKNYQTQATTMIILLYFFEGVSRIFEEGLNPILATIEIILSVCVFYGALKHLGPIKKAARSAQETAKKTE